MDTPHDPPTPAATLQEAAGQCARISSALLVALRADQWDDSPEVERLLPDDFAALARQAAHHGRIVLRAIARLCSRCHEPLFAVADRLTGVCTPCREDARARLAAAQGRFVARCHACDGDITIDLRGGGVVACEGCGRIYRGYETRMPWVAEALALRADLDGAR